MKIILTTLLLTSTLLLAADQVGTLQQKVVATSRFSREALTNETPAAWRSKLEIESFTPSGFDVGQVLTNASFISTLAGFQPAGNYASPTNIPVNASQLTNSSGALSAISGAWMTNPIIWNGFKVVTNVPLVTTTNYAKATFITYSQFGTLTNYYVWTNNAYRNTSFIADPMFVLTNSSGVFKLNHGDFQWTNTTGFSGTFYSTGFGSATANVTISTTSGGGVTNVAAIDNGGVISFSPGIRIGSLDYSGPLTPSSLTLAGTTRQTWPVTNWVDITTYVAAAIPATLLSSNLVSVAAYNSNNTTIQAQIIVAISAATNSAAAIGTNFTSGEYSITNSGLIANVAHGLAGVPQFSQWFLVCKTNDIGYVAGDQIPVLALTGVSPSTPAFVEGKNATNVFLVSLLGGSPYVGNYWVATKTNGLVDQITGVRWRAKCVAQYR